MPPHSRARPGQSPPKPKSKPRQPASDQATPMVTSKPTATTLPVSVHASAPASASSAKTSRSDLFSALSKSHTIHTLNIISSSKINAKVTQTLRLLSLLPSTTPTEHAKMFLQNQDSTSNSATNAPASKLLAPQQEDKPILVTLTAKPPALNKIISIVEIAKRDIIARRAKIGELDIGQGKPKLRLFQYTALSELPSDVKTNKVESEGRQRGGRRGLEKGEGDKEVIVIGKRKRAGDGGAVLAMQKALEEGTAEAEAKARAILETVEAGTGRDENEDEGADVIAPKKARIASPAPRSTIDDTRGTDEEKGEENYFAPLPLLKSHAVAPEKAEATPSEVYMEERTRKKHGLPLLTIYLSTRRIPALAEAYGEQEV